MESSACTLVLFCKPPERSKRRLAAEIGEAPAGRLAERLLDCALEDASAWPGPVVVSPADAGDVAWAATLGVTATVVPQSSGNLGERLSDIDRRLRADGRRRLLYIGADCPTLDVNVLQRAADAMPGTDIVLGRARDGGVVYMGSAVPWPALAGLPWSTGRLAAALAEACTGAGLEVDSRGDWRDVDHASDLGPLWTDLKNDDRPARRRLLAWLETEAWNRQARQG